MPSIKCGNCGETHTEILQVRECYATKTGGFEIEPKSPRQLRDERAVEDKTSNGKPITVPAQHNANGEILGDPVGASPRQAQYVYDLLLSRDLGGTTEPQEVIDLFVEEHLKTIAEGRLTYKAAVGLIKSLKDLPTAPENSFMKAREAERLTRVAAGTTIDVIIQDGVFRNPETGQLWKAQFNRGTGDGRHLYAKKGSVIEDEDGRKILLWDYAGAKPLRDGTIKEDWRLTLAEAKEFGELYGRCMRCHRELTDEGSIEARMGRVCSGKAEAEGYWKPAK